MSFNTHGQCIANTNINKPWVYEILASFLMKSREAVTGKQGKDNDDVAIPVRQSPSNRPNSTFYNSNNIPPDWKEMYSGAGTEESPNGHLIWTLPHQY